MAIYEITADVYGSWGTEHPCYRVYVDNDLLTERTFIWPGHEVYIKEHLAVDLKPGAHELRIEQINGHGKIQVKNITLDGAPSEMQFATNR